MDLLKPSLLVGFTVFICTAAALPARRKILGPNVCSILGQSDNVTKICNNWLNNFELNEGAQPLGPSLFFVCCIGISVPSEATDYKKYHEPSVSILDISKLALSMKNTKDAMTYAHCIRCTASKSGSYTKEDKVSEHFTWSVKDVEKCHAIRGCDPH